MRGKTNGFGEQTVLFALALPERKRAKGRFNARVIRGWAMGISMSLILVLLSYPGLALAQGGTAGGGSDITGALQKLTMAFVDFLIGVSALLLAIGIATGFLNGMVESMVGRPGGLASTWMRLAGVVVCFIGAILTIAIANSIISSLSGLGGGTITLPK